jgi:hypothetical protein
MSASGDGFSSGNAAIAGRNPPLPTPYQRLTYPETGGATQRCRNLRNGDPTLCGTEEQEGGTLAAIAADRDHRRRCCAVLSEKSFPTTVVYGPTSQSALRLITCGGSFNRATGAIPRQHRVSPTSPATPQSR